MEGTIRRGPPLPLVAALGLLVAGAACEPRDPDAEVMERMDPMPTVTDQPAVGPAVAYVAQLHPLSESGVWGQVTFVDLGDDLHVEALVTGLREESRHGFHVHEGTSCEAPGDHFRPFDREHGAPEDPPEQRHQGDLGNLVSNAEGVAVYSRTIEGVFLTGEPGMVGRAVVVHAERDDPEAQPFGEAGELMACGIIEAVP